MGNASVNRSVSTVCISKDNAVPDRASNAIIMLPNRRLQRGQAEPTTGTQHHQQPCNCSGGINTIA